MEPPVLEDISSEGELPDSDQEDHSGTPALEELLMRQEELEDYDSLNSSPVNNNPLWKFSEQTPTGSQAQTRTIKIVTSQAKPVNSTPAKPAVPQSKAPAQAMSQAPAQAPVGPPASAQPVRQAPASFPLPQATALGGLYACPQNLLTRIDSPTFLRVKPP